MKRFASYRRRMLTVVCLLLLLAPPTVAYAATFNYASGVNGSGGTFGNPGFNSYLFNQVWHTQNYYWEVYYLLSNGGKAGSMVSFNNPTRWGGSIGYGNPRCYNITDNSGATWTCQYGK